MTPFNRSREHYLFYKSIETRWIDNDVYGHVNNALYYTFFDTVCNAYLIEAAGLDITDSPIVGFIVASSCQYHAPVKFPMTIDAGMRVNRIGNRSVEYGVALFESGAAVASAHGTFTHVFVERATGKSVSIPESFRAALNAVLLAPPDDDTAAAG